jgi:translation initiation factor 2 subunit 3
MTVEENNNSINQQQHLQAVINIGTLGHVANGKTTLVEKLTGINTQKKHSSDTKRNMTIQLGYANTKIMYCSVCDLYSILKSEVDTLNTTHYCDKCPSKNILELARHVSFVDCPGHHELMSVMLSGAAVMDTALLLSAYKLKQGEQVVESQTIEHLAAAEMMGLTQMIIIQNKVDLAPDTKEIFKHYQNVRKETDCFQLARKSHVVPISAQMGYNVDFILRKIVEQTQSRIESRTLSLPARMIIIRSFDVNKPSTDWNALSGGVAGGTLMQGTLRVGDSLELRPGLIQIIPPSSSKKSTDIYSTQYRCVPILSVCVSLSAESNSLELAVPGGLIGVQTKIDPTLAKKNRLVGQILGHAGTLPNILIVLHLRYELNPVLVTTLMEQSGKTSDNKFDIVLGEVKI